MSRWFIDSIEITGGFLPGLSLAFPRGLTCIIGPRGSGKTTLVEALRFGLGGTAGISKSGLALLNPNLSSSVITIRTSSDDDGIGYIIKRAEKQSVSLTTIDGKPISSVDLDRRTFLPLDAYSSKEIEDIADEEDGDKRRSLLDELHLDEVQAIRYNIAEQRRALDASADNIRRTRNLITDLTERIEELGDARARLSALPEPIESSDSPDLVKAAQQQQATDIESANLAAARSYLVDYRNKLHSISTTYKNQLNKSLSADGSANTEHIYKVEKAITTALNALEQHIAQMIGEIKDAEKVLDDVDTTLRNLHEQQNSHYAKLQEQNLAASQIIQQRVAAEQSVANLESLEAQRAAEKTKLEILIKEREQLRAAYLLECEKISEIRDKVAARLQDEVGSNIKIQVRRNADSLRYQQLLIDGLRGARVRGHDEIIEKLMCLRPEQLAQIIQERDEEEFEHQMSLGSERSRKILDAFCENIDPMELELVSIDDRVRIELNVATGAEPNYKDAADLSRGQKCTALLPLLLARRNTPLVIDQPEDNLDNRFVYETVVASIRRLKQHRQMIFVTHNANIPVLAEADLIVVLNSDGKAGFIQKAASLDECCEEIIELLEGGKEAFELRRARYAKQ